MYDHGNAMEYFYGNVADTYTGLQETNALIYKRAGSQSRYWAMGNPYVVKETYPEGKEAIRSDARLYKYQLSLIRNSGAVALVVTDDDGNYLSVLDISELVTPAFYYSGGGYWMNTLQSYTINCSVSALGAEEGDRIHVSVVSIPEYYCKDAAPTEDELKALLDSGVLGTGTTLTSSFTVDDTAPEIKSVTKNEETGALELQYTVTLDLKRDDMDHYDATYRCLRCLAIDDDGTFYDINKGSYALTRLFQWSSDDQNADGSMTVVGKCYVRPTWDQGFSILTDDTAQGLTWDHDADELYLANSYEKMNNEFYLTRVDTTTGLCYNVAGTDAATPILGCAIRGLYIVPKEEVTPSGSTETATAILVQPDAMSVSKGTTTQLAVSVFPWNLRDQSVTWRSSDPDTVSVDASGTITAKELGSAVITATTVSEPHLEGSCTITVTEVPSVNLNALLYQADGTAQWVEFNTASPENYTVVSECGEAFVAGTMVGSNLWMQDAYGDLYKVQPDFFDEELDSALGSYAAADYAPIPSYGRLILLSDGGTLLSNLDPSTHQLGYLDLTATFEDDPMATVAYWKTTGGGSGFFVTPKTDYFYMLSESGKLYTFSYSKNFFMESLTTPQLVADIGFQQTDVSLMNGQYGSMIYVAECNSLFVVSYLDGESTHLYQINMDNYRVTDLGDFGEGNYPAVALYQYDRNNAMRVTMSSTYEALFIGETTELSAKVFPADQNAVTWESSDESIATVNESGRVTGISAGTVTITATTVGVDGDGNHAYAEATVYVKSDNYQATGTVGAMVKTNDGNAQWIEIDLATLETTKLADSELYFTGGGRFGDKLYGSDYSFTYEDENEVFHIYSVDPENGYELHQGVQPRVDYAMLDMTLVPKTEFQINGHNFSYGGVPSYLSSSVALIQLLDMDNGVTMSHGGYYFFNTNFGAMAFKEVTFEEDGVPVYYHYVLTCNGDLYLSCMQFSEQNGQLAAGLRCEKLLNIGITFGDYDGSLTAYDKTKMSMTNINGDLIISNTANGVVTLYYVDTDNLEAGAERIGVVEGISAMSSLYSDMDATLTEIVYEPKTEAAEGELQKTFIESADEPVVEMVVAEAMGAPVPANEVTGATSAVSAEAANLSGASTSIGTLVRVTLTESVDTTNGLVTVQYDPAELMFVGIDTGATIKAWNKDASNGKISFAYASAQPIAAGDSIATLVFSARKTYTNTSVTVSTVERNQEAPVNEGAVVISVSTRTPITPNPDVTPVIPVLPEPETPEFSFVDVPANEYYYDAVQWAVENGITTGTSATTFSPDDACTRAQVVTFLWRAAGCPTAPNSVNPFTDVSPDSYCYDAVLWAVEQGITTGTSATTFSPDDACTRAQIVTFLWRAAGCPSVANDAHPFTDTKSGDYYYDAVLWAVAKSITTGTSATTFTPDDVCTRAQVVTFLYRS